MKEAHEAYDDELGTSLPYRRAKDKRPLSIADVKVLTAATDSLGQLTNRATAQKVNLSA